MGRTVLSVHNHNQSATDRFYDAVYINVLILYCFYLHFKLSLSLIKQLYSIYITYIFSLTFIVTYTLYSSFFLRSNLLAYVNV